MNPLVLPGEEARPAEISHHHGQEVLVERGKKQKTTYTVKEEGQREEGPAAAPRMASGGSEGMWLGQPASGGSLGSWSKGGAPRAERRRGFMCR